MKYTNTQSPRFITNHSLHINICIKVCKHKIIQYFVDFDLKMETHATILMSALSKVSVRTTLNVKTIKEVLVATVLMVTKDTTVATSMSVTVKLVVTRTPNAQTRTEATPAAV